MTRFLTIDELIYINEQLVESIHTIVDGKRKVRDMTLLEMSWARPMQSVFGQDAYPSLQEKATALLHSIARNHPFADGNKRTATVAAIFMLAVNGFQIQWDAHAALKHIVEIAQGQINVPDFAAWLPTIPDRPSLEPDANADTQLIHQIINTHNWLLNELAKR